MPEVIRRKNFLDRRKGLDDTMIADGRPDIADRGDREDLVAEVDGVVVGGLVLYFYPSTGGVVLDELRVHPDHRGSGVGGRLINRATTWVRNYNTTDPGSVTQFIAHVETPNMKTQFEAQGWTVRTVHPNSTGWTMETTV